MGCGRGGGGGGGGVKKVCISGADKGECQWWLDEEGVCQWWGVRRGCVSGGRGMVGSTCYEHVDGGMVTDPQHLYHLTEGEIS